MQTKEQRLQSRIEPVIYKIMLKEAHNMGMKTGPYIRMLILKDLKQRGALDDQTITRMVMG